jgi:hypothetical protein
MWMTTEWLTFLDALRGPDGYYPKFELSTRHGERWRERLGRFPLPQALKALDAWADKSSRTPPALDELLKLLGVRAVESVQSHLHSFSRWGGDYVTCDTCGRHGQDCNCPICACGRRGHPKKTCQPDGTWFCDDCKAVLRHREGAMA